MKPTKTVTRKQGKAKGIGIIKPGKKGGEYGNMKVKGVDRGYTSDIPKGK
jgi:hypothetical protein